MPPLTLFENENGISDILYLLIVFYKRILINAVLLKIPWKVVLVLTENNVEIFL